MEITACPVCGSKNIGIGTLGDGIISGLSSWNEVCRNCGYRGASLVFDSESEYQRFLDSLTVQKQHEEAQSRQEDKETQQERGSETAKEPRKNNKYLFELVVSIVLTIVFFIILSGSNYFGMYSNIFSQNTLGVVVGYIVCGFIGIILFFFLLIVLGETLYRSIVRKKH